MIDYVQLVPNGKYVASNLESVHYSGAEASLQLRWPHDQQTGLSYTVVHGAQDALHGLQSRYAFNYPTHRAVVSWIGELPGKIQARSQLGVVQRFERDSYALWDLAVSREFAGRVRANLQFSNITGTRYEEIQNVAMPGQSLIFGLDFVLWRHTR